MKKIISILIAAALLQMNIAHADDANVAEKTANNTTIEKQNNATEQKDDPFSERVQGLFLKALDAIDDMIPDSNSKTSQNSAQNQTSTLPNWVTKRQLVDLLLNEALTAFKSPARISHAGFTGKLQNNLDIVADRVQKAYQLEPYRADLLFSLAGAYTANGDIENSIKTYQTILAKFPGELDAITYLASWQRFLNNQDIANQLFSKLQMSDAGRAAKLQRTFKSIDRAVSMPISDKLSDEQKQAFGNGSHVAIVTLGYALNPDGTMHDILISRLEKTLELASELPDSIIVVTGGVPQNNQTEGTLMADWLVNKGIKAERIFQDNAARSTVENALFSRYILTNQNIEKAIVISSGSHVRRGQALFEIAADDIGAGNIQFSAIAALDKPLADLQVATESDIKGIYRDALKTMGLWSFRSYPLEER